MNFISFLPPVRGPGKCLDRFLITQLKIRPQILPFTTGQAVSEEATSKEQSITNTSYCVVTRETQGIKPRQAPRVPQGNDQIRAELGLVYNHPKRENLWAYRVLAIPNQSEMDKCIVTCLSQS